MSELKKRKYWLWFPIGLTTYEIEKRDDDYELVITKGLLSKHIDRIKLYRITDLTFERSIGNWFCGVANIIVHSTDPSGTSKYSSNKTIEKIRGAKDFLSQLETLVQQERKRMNVKYSETVLQ